MSAESSVKKGNISDFYVVTVDKSEGSNFTLATGSVKLMSKTLEVTGETREI